jgi:hypothetical protein
VTLLSSNHLSCLCSNRDTSNRELFLRVNTLEAILSLYAFRRCFKEADAQTREPLPETNSVSPQRVTRHELWGQKPRLIWYIAGPVGARVCNQTHLCQSMKR